MRDGLLDRPAPSRVVVRPFVDADLAGFLAYQGLPAVRRYQPGTPMSESEAAAFVAEQGRQRPDARGAWHARVIELVAGRRVIGDLGVWIPVVLDDPAVGDLGFQLDPRHQGVGYAREARSSGFARRTQCPADSSRSTAWLVPPTVIASASAMSRTRQSGVRSIVPRLRRDRTHRFPAARHPPVRARGLP